MNPLGYLFALVGVFAIRQVIVGRAADIPGDAKDAANALLGGDTTSFAEVMSRRGTNVTAEDDGAVGSATPYGSAVTSSLFSGEGVGNVQLAATVKQLGSAARGYVTGGVGPTYYDCSGLVWKACYQLKLYTGGRFTTSTFTSVASSFCKQIPTPSVGDIVLWEGHHMGVCDGTDSVYSAESPAKGIGDSSIAADNKYFGKPATYWRITSGAAS